MVHPQRAKETVRVPRFSELVGSSTSPSLPSPYASENTFNSLPSPPVKRPFNPRVATYSLAFITVIVGGIYLGAASKDMMERWEQRKQWKTFTPEEKIADLRKLREGLVKERRLLEDQIAVIQVQAKSQRRYEHRLPKS